MRLFHGDCRKVLPQLSDVDAVVTDPPYGLSFMGKGWDHGVPGVEFWEGVLGAMKPGAHLLAFGGTRTFHRLACAIEDAGFEIRDCVMWVYGTGFPKSLDVGEAIDKAAGAERPREKAQQRINPSNAISKSGFGKDGWSPQTKDAQTDAAKQWDGWGTALKPAWEPIILARKPLGGTVAANVLEHGVGGLNVDGCRVGTDGGTTRGDGEGYKGTSFDCGNFGVVDLKKGRWPANVIHDGSEEAVELFPQTAPGKSGGKAGWQKGGYVGGKYEPIARTGYDDHGGSAARFFYCAKTSKKDRGEDNDHPTVKPTDLMRYLCRLVTPPGGVVLDPFMGSGSTGKAAIQEGFRFIGIDAEEHYCDIARKRLTLAEEESLKDLLQ